MFNFMETLKKWSIPININSYNKGQIMYQTGEVCHHLDYIISGEAVIQHINYDGQLITLTAFKAMDTIGGNRLFSSNNHYPMTISAKLSLTMCRLSKIQVLELCQKDETFLKWFLRELADKSDLLSHRIKSLSFMSIEDRILQFVEHKKDDSGYLKLPFSKKEWAEKMGVSRTSLSRTLQKMKEHNILDYNNRDIQLNISRMK